MSKAPEDQLAPATRRAIRRTFLTLLAVGMLLGGVTALGVVTIMHRLDLIGVSEQQP